MGIDPFSISHTFAKAAIAAAVNPNVLVQCGEAVNFDAFNGPISIPSSCQSTIQDTNRVLAQ